MSDWGFATLWRTYGQTNELNRELCCLTLSEPRFFRCSENWYVEYSLCTYVTIRFIEQNFSFEGTRPEKGLKIWPFSKMSKPKSSFLNIFQKFLQKWTLITLFTHNTPHVKFSLFFFLVVGGPKNLKVFFIISKKIFQLGVVNFSFD